MPVFKNYDATGKLLNTTTEPLSKKNIDRFILEQGEEKAKMYLEILSEITKEVGNTLYENIGESILTPRTSYMTKKLTDHFYWNKVSVIKISKQHLENMDMDKPSPH